MILNNPIFINQTDAINIPDLQQLASQLGVKKLNKIGSYNKNQEIEIPIN